MNDFWQRTWLKMPRHGAGLLGVGAAYVYSLYLSIFIAELIMEPFTDLTSVTKSFLRFLSGPSWNDVLTIGIFLFLWVFMAAIALAGGTRYLIGCVDPQHIAQRTFVVGVKYYTKRMLAYSTFLALSLLALLSTMFVFVYFIKPVSTMGYIVDMLVFVVLAFLVIALSTKITYTPAFIIQGDILLTAVKKSWIATKRRFWTIVLIRSIVFTIALAPVIIKYLAGVTIPAPSVSMWPYFALMILGLEEFIVIRGFQEYEEERKLPLISPMFFKQDVTELEEYNPILEDNSSMDM